MFWPRNADGSWVARPRLHWKVSDYTEQSPETAVWGVPYDVAGVAALVGGPAALEAMLDDYFDRIYYRKDGGEMTHHENEPTHHIPYLYAALGRPDKCARHVRRILSRGYSAERWGMEGNDDCGQMSAWYVLSALGFYPLDPTTGEYVIGSPLVRSATLKVGAPFAPATFRVVVRNQSRDNWRVRSVTLDGRPLTGGRLRHADIVKGGELVFEMDDGLPRARPAAGRFRQLLVPLHQRPAGVHAVGAGCFYARVLLPSAGGLDDVRLLVLVGFPGGEVGAGARVCLCARARPAQGRARLLSLYGSDRRDERERLGQPNHLHGGHGLQRRRMASSGCRLRAEDRPGRVGHGPACSPTRPARRDTSRRASRRCLARS